jgi:hypothetical protein
LSADLFGAPPQLKLGRLPNVPTKPRLRLGSFIDHQELGAPQPSVNWYSSVPAWPMYANDSIGDCTIAEVGHQIGSSSTYATVTGRELLFSDTEIISMYSAVTGYVPGDESTDQGAVIQDVLAYWRKTGLAGHKIDAFAEVDVSNRAEILQAVAAFGSLDLGHTVTQGDMDAFTAGEPWDTAGDPAVLGGHSTELVGYDATYGYLVTWGQVQRFTWRWWSARVDEAWLAILPEWIAASGAAPSGFDLYGLGEELHTLTGDPNPFPAPVPPAPPAGDPDHALWLTAQPWCAKTRTRADLVLLKAALQAWSQAKGL